MPAISMFYGLIIRMLFMDTHFPHRTATLGGCHAACGHRCPTLAGLPPVFDF